MAERMLRPLAMGDIFDEAFDLYKDNFALFVLVTAATLVPLQMALTVAALRFSREFQSLTTIFGGDVPDPTQIFAALGPVLHSLALYAPVYMIGYGLQMTALASAASARYLGDAASLRSAYRIPLQHFLSLVVAAALYGLANALGFLVCYVGLAVPLTLYAFSAHTFTAEGYNRNGWSALKRSASLANGQGGRIFGALLLLSLVYSLLSLGMTLPLRYGLTTLLSLVPGLDGLTGGAAAGRTFGARTQVIGQISGGVAGLLLDPFVISVLTVLYYDVRVRKEAFDTELLAQRLGYPVLPWSVIYNRPARPARPRPVRGAGKAGGAN